MTRWTVPVAALAIAATQTVRAQTHQPYAGPEKPYASLEKRPIKALSDQQIADLRAGRGMGMALAAELNGYPGPLHVLELAEPLGLTPDQRARIADLFEAMKAEAAALGEKLIAAEADLDRQFADRTITQASLGAGTEKVAALNGGLRATHLKYHLLTVAVLTPAQVERYGTLRGYGGAAPKHQHGSGHN